VINVNHLAIGNCAYLYVVSVQGVNVVINVPGRGRKVRIGIEADTWDGINLLAPERTVEVVGAGSDIGTYFGRIWARRGIFKGFAEQVEDYGGCGYQ
jgi:hypothetical protein